MNIVHTCGSCNFTDVKVASALSKTKNNTNRESSKTKFLTYVKLVLISDTYCILIYCYIPLLPHKKGTN